MRANQRYKGADMIPSDLLFTQSHEWTKIDEEIALVGISHFAQEQLGDITFVELPEVGTLVEQGEEMGSIESVKAASEIYSPITGEVVAVNEDLATAPERINEAPYDEGWLIKVRISGKPSGLMTAEEYENFITGQSH
jgi:glycine cleavage system H protein